MQIRVGKIALFTLGFAWLAGALRMIVGNVVLRETRLGIIAQFLDKLPPAVAKSDVHFPLDCHALWMGRTPDARRNRAPTQEAAELTP